MLHKFTNPLLKYYKNVKYNKEKFWSYKKLRVSKAEKSQIY
jgi:hypothetical protein